MSPKKALEREDLVQAALDLIRKAGWEGVSARSLAASLGLSTMPIYTLVPSMDTLWEACLLEVARLMDKAQHVKRSDNPALDLAIGYVAFAQEEPKLFTFLLSAAGDMDRVIKEAAASPDFEKDKPAAELLGQVFRDLPGPGQRDSFVFRSWIFTHGLADLVSSGRLALSEAEIAGHLEAAGGAFYMFEKLKEER